MYIVANVFIGLLIGAGGSIAPGYLNMTVVKFSLKWGRGPALYLTAGICLILFLQANLGAYLSNILLKSSDYLTHLRIGGSVILILLSMHFFRLYFLPAKKKKQKEIAGTKAFFRGLVLAALNTFAIPFYFVVMTFLSESGVLEYSIANALRFALGSAVGSFLIYGAYAVLSKRVEKGLILSVSRMNFVLGCLTGVMGVANVIQLYMGEA